MLSGVVGDPGGDRERDRRELAGAELPGQERSAEARSGTDGGRIVASGR
jgi:hypothetical protein